MSIIYINISEDIQKKPHGNEFQYIKEEINKFLEWYNKNKQFWLDSSVGRARD